MRRPPKQEWISRWRPPILILPRLFWLIFTDRLSTAAVFHLAWINISVDSMAPYLDTTQVAQVVQFLRGVTSIHAVPTRFAVPPSTISRAWGFQETVKLVS